MGLKIGDLAGRLEEVEIINFSQTEKDENKIVVLRVKQGNKVFDVGLYGSSTIQKILEDHGFKVDDKNFLEIPASKMTEDKIIWFNQPY